MEITVGISFYNAERYFKEAIQSVLNQTFRDFELLLLDDGSTDSSLQIARSFADSRIKVISDGENHGLAYRLNELVSMAQGKYFVRMDADDIMHTKRLEMQLAYLKEHADVDVLGTYSYSIDTNNQLMGVLRKALVVDNIQIIIAHNCLTHPSVMAQTQWFKDNPYDEKAVRMEDFNLWLRTFDKYKIANLPQCLMFYREVGVPYLKKYLQSQKGERNEYRKFRSQLPNYYKLLVKNYMKCSVYILASAVGMRDYLVALRSKKIDDKIKETATKELQQAIAFN